MSANAYERALARDALSQAWKDIFAKSSSASRKTVGSDDISINDFEVNSKSLWGTLGREVQSRKFRFLPLRPYLIPKSNGKDRLVCVPTVRDRIVQRALVDYLSQKYRHHLANKVSYGFIKGRSVKEAATNACQLRAKKQWIFKTDITAFFDNINREALATGLKKVVRESSLHGILTGALSCEVARSSKGTERRIEALGIRRGLGVRQGMPLSPLFSNVMLLPFDQEIQKQGISAIRYADDLIFFASSKEECQEIFAFCEIELAKLKLAIPPVGPGSKSVIYEPDEPADFLGLELAGKKAGRYELKLSSKQIQRIREEILQYAAIPELLARKVTLKNLGQILTNKRNGYLAAYDVCENVLEVQKSLADVEQKVLRNLYTNGLQIDLSALSRDAKTFLGLT